MTEARGAERRGDRFEHGTVEADDAGREGNRPGPSFSDPGRPVSPDRISLRSALGVRQRARQT